MKNLSGIQGQGHDGARYAARFAQNADDLHRAGELRARSFLTGGAAAETAVDADDYDQRCQHVLVEDVATGKLALCYRMLILPDGQSIATTYSAQFYDLERLRRFKGGIVELGRFCSDASFSDPDILRTAWGMLMRLGRDNATALLIGCSSFPGTDPQAHAASFARLTERHLIAPRWRPDVKSPYATTFRDLRLDPAGAVNFPPLLRFYLGLGAQTSDHAVADPELRTVHVFTALQTARIPSGRLQTLLSLA